MPRRANAQQLEGTMKHLRIFSLTLLAVTLGAGLALAQGGSSAAEGLKSPDANTRAKAARELGKEGDLSAVAPLTAALTDPSTKVRHEVVLALSSFHTPQALDALITATRDSDADIRVDAVHGLVGYYTGETPSFGFIAFWGRTWRTAKSRFVEENVRVDPSVKVDPKVVSALVTLMKDTSVIKPAREAADALGILMAEGAVADLVAAANSSDEDLAVDALNALTKIKDTTAGPKLVNLLDSPDKEVRREAAVTVGILRTSEALPKLQSMYQNGPDARTREKALEGLSYLGSPISLPIFLQALWSADKAYRPLAAEGLARAGDPKALPDLLKAVQSEKDADAHLAIEFGITALGRDDFLNDLVNQLASKRGDSAQTYLIELSRKPEFLAKLYPYLDNSDPDIRRRLCLVLMYSGDQSSVGPLERLSHDPNNDVAAAAIRALSAIRARSSPQGAAPSAGTHP
jgi:HEAT repeat protein